MQTKYEKCSDCINVYTDLAATVSATELFIGNSYNVYAAIIYSEKSSKQIHYNPENNLWIINMEILAHDYVEMPEFLIILLLTYAVSLLGESCL